jgi:hypothetical protein
MTRRRRVVILPRSRGRQTKETPVRRVTKAKVLTSFFVCLFLSASVLYAAEEKKSDGAFSPLVQNFINFPPFLIPVIQDRRVVTTYAITLVIETVTAHDAVEIYPFVPRLTDALLTDMYTVFCLAWSPDTRVFLKDLKTRLLGVAQKVAGKKHIKAVLIQSFQEQIHK